MTKKKLKQILWIILFYITVIFRFILNHRYIFIFVVGITPLLLTPLFVYAQSHPISLAFLNHVLLLFTGHICLLIFCGVQAYLLWEACSCKTKVQVHEVVFKTIWYRSNWYKYKINKSMIPYHSMTYTYNVNNIIYKGKGPALTDTESVENKTNFVNKFFILYNQKYPSIHCIDASVLHTCYKQYKKVGIK